MFILETNEGRFYQDNSHTAFMMLYRNVFKDGVRENFNQTVCTLIGSIIEFKEDNNYDLRHQCLSDTWNKWEILLNNTKLQSFVSQGDTEKDISFHKSKKWLIKSPYMNITLEYLVEVDFEYEDDGTITLKNTSLPKLFDELGMDFNDRFLMFVLQLLDKGKSKLDYKKLSVVNNMRLSKGKQKIKSIYHAHMLIDRYVDGRGDFNLGISMIEDYDDDSV